MPGHTDLAVFTSRGSVPGFRAQETQSWQVSPAINTSWTGRGCKNQTTDAKKGMCHSPEGCSPICVYLCPQQWQQPESNVHGDHSSNAESSQSMRKAGPTAWFIFFNKFFGSFPYQIHLPMMLRQLFRNGSLKKY